MKWLGVYSGCVGDGGGGGVLCCVDRCVGCCRRL